MGDSLGAERERCTGALSPFHGERGEVHMYCLSGPYKSVIITIDKSVSIKSVSSSLTRDCLDNSLAITFTSFKCINPIFILGLF